MHGGGAIANNSTLTISGTTVEGNSAYTGYEVKGAGIYNGGSLNISESTLDYNEADNAQYIYGAAIANAGYSVISDTTITSNYAVSGPYVGGGGISNISLEGYSTGSVLVDTIVANNTAISNGATNAVGQDIDGSVNSSSIANLIGNPGGLAGISNGSNGNLVGVPAGLSGLGSYGGPTLTNALTAGSLALGAGSAPTTLATIMYPGDATLNVNDASRLGLIPGISVIQIDQEQLLVTAISGNSLSVQRAYNGTTAELHEAGVGVFPAFDQRGEPRLRNGSLDIGAYEAEVLPITVLLTDNGPNPSYDIQTISFGVQVSGGSPTGLVQLLDTSNNNAVVASGTLVAASNGSINLTIPANTFLAGSHSLVAVYAGDSNYSGGTSPAVVQVVYATIPSVASVVINPGEGTLASKTYLGNSRVLSIQVTFGTPVNTTALQNAFTLTRAGLPNGVAGDNATIGTISVSTSTNASGDTVATLTFSGTNTEGGSLGDGIWTLTINAADVINDGASMSANYTQTGILRLFGDYLGTQVVDSADLGELGSTFGLQSTSAAFLPAFDSDGNGVIDSVDLSAFGTRFGLSI